ncbi:MAG: pseudouridine synthase [Patescibacteria group bacterium]
MNIVLQKYIADSGYCSRRQAEALIRSHEVKVNGKIAELGQRVSDEDVVLVGKNRIGGKLKNVYIKLNKPRDYVCTTRDFKEEKNVFDLLEGVEATRLFIVGRLDKNSRGLLILTNDGELSQQISHPKYESEKVYKVLVKTPDGDNLSDVQASAMIAKFKKGVDIGDDDGVVFSKDVTYLDNNRFLMTLTQGKKRQIRRMFEAAGMKVSDLIRVEISGIKLGILEEGKWEYLTEEEVRKLKNKFN